MSEIDTRTHLAWLLWCFQEGYVTSEDRMILKNWLLSDPGWLRPEDIELRENLLEMADEILAALRKDLLR